MSFKTITSAWQLDMEEMTRRSEMDTGQQQSQQAMQQSMADAAMFGSGQVQAQQSSSGNLTFNIPSQRSAYSYTGRLTFNQNPWGEPPPPNLYRHAEDFVYGLNNLDPRYVKEIVVIEFVYMEIMGMMKLDGKGPDVLKSLQYHLPYGIILLRNEKYQFDLDKYLEDGPTKELVKE